MKADGGVQAKGVMKTEGAESAYRVLRTCLLVFLAFDIVATHMVPLSHVGIAGFNVPHFSILNGWPASMELNMGLLILAMLGCLASAVRYKPMFAAVTFIAYTLSWSTCMIDSYQHHVLLSWLLLGFCAVDSKGSEPTALKLTHITLACVYGYTVVTKLNVNWWNGETLARANTLGFDFYGLSVANAARLTLFVEMLLTAVYALKAFGVSEKEFKGLYAFAGLLGIGFHLGSVKLGLDIGWFAYYMMGIHLILLSPQSWWDGVVKRVPQTKVFQGVAGISLLVLLALSPLYFKPHYDFYRFRGGDLARVQEGETDGEKKKDMLEEAIEMYEGANRHAPNPEGKREKKLLELKSQLERLKE